MLDHVSLAPALTCDPTKLAPGAHEATRMRTETEAYAPELLGIKSLLGNQRIEDDGHVCPHRAGVGCRRRVENVAGSLFPVQNHNIGVLLGIGSKTLIITLT